MRLMAHLPLSWVRGLGVGLGWVLYVLAVPRRHVVAVNLKLCFPQASLAQRKAWTRQAFIHFAQSWLDRGWLWHAPREVLARRIRLVGPWQEFEGDTPTIIFSPHFFGLEAGGMALSMNVDRVFTSIFTPQPSPAVDAWIICSISALIWVTAWVMSSASGDCISRTWMRTPRPQDRRSLQASSTVAPVC